MKKTTLKIFDQCNLKFEDLDAETRRKLVEVSKFLVPHAFALPSVKLGRWDGRIAFTSIGGRSFINLLDRLLPIIIDAGYEIEVVDDRPEYKFEFPEIKADMFSHETWPEGHILQGQPIILRDYQVTTISNFINNLQSIQDVATGAGKSIVCSALSKIVEPYGRSLLIVPSKSLIVQTEIDYKNLKLDTGVYFGERKELGHTHTISTWQSLNVLYKDNKINSVTNNLICVINDECHGAKAQILKDMLTGPLAEVPIRLGLTGTIPKEDYEYQSLVCSIGPVIGSIKTAELQKRGVLADCNIDIIQIKDEDLEFSNYEDEFNYLVTNKGRLQWIAQYCFELSKTGNTLILVDRIETGEFLVSQLPESVFIRGSMKVANRKKEFDEFRTSQTKIMVASSKIVSTGIDLPRLYNLVLLEPGKSFVKTIQSVGRLLRKTSDKDHGLITDFCSTLKYSSRHISKRRSFYKDAEHPFETRKMDYKVISPIEAVKK